MVVYATPLERFVALIIDYLITSAVLSIVAMICLAPGILGVMSHHEVFQRVQDAGNNDTLSPEDTAIVTPIYIEIFIGLGVYFILAMLILFLYHAFMESSASGATFGKQVMRIRLQTVDGQRVSFMQAIGRMFIRLFVSQLVCWTGFIVAFFTEKSQTLHDLATNVVVVKK